VCVTNFSQGLSASYRPQFPGDRVRTYQRANEYPLYSHQILCDDAAVSSVKRLKENESLELGDNRKGFDRRTATDESLVYLDVRFVCGKKSCCNLIRR